MIQGAGSKGAISGREPGTQTLPNRASQIPRRIAVGHGLFDLAPLLWAIYGHARLGPISDWSGVALVRTGPAVAWY